MKNKELFTLGKLYVSDFVKQNQEPRAGKEDLTLMLEEKSGAVRLKHATDPNKLYGQYWYRSGINTTMTNELHSIVTSCIDCCKINDGDLWLDIACNDGTLLKFVPDKMKK